MKLNAEQFNAVAAEHLLKVVIAGPGSGKTLTLTEAIRRRANTSIMVVITFTNSAAHELRKRTEGIELAYCGTLHGLGIRMLRRFHTEAGYETKPTIAPEVDKRRRLKAIRDRLAPRLSEKEVMAGASAPAIQIWAEYGFELRRNNLIDFDGILSDFSKLLLVPAVLAELHIDDLFVDEAQDSAAIDWVIYDLFPAQNKFYVGDLDQAIFEFRGAFPSALVWRAERPSAQTFKLETNYRSATLICTAADRLIAHNTERITKIMRPVRTDSGEITWVVAPDWFQEMDWIAGLASAHLASGWTCGILCRRNYEARSISNYFLGQGISQFEQVHSLLPPDFGVAILLLGLLDAPTNRAIGAAALRALHPEWPVDQWLLELDADRGDNYSGAINRILTAQHPMPRLRLPRYLAENGISQETIEIIGQRAALLADDADLTALIDDLHSHEPERQVDAPIYIGTIHRAKGREFDAVILPAFEEGIFPDPRSPIEEERRLCFVALTRARNRIDISMSRTRPLPWSRMPVEAKASPFLAEFHQ